MFDEFIENKKDEIVKEVCNLINIPSVSLETKDPSQPFGEGCKKALDYILYLGKKLGFRTKNIDGYSGYIEFGEGEKLVGIIGHLDVVPSGDGWIAPPFEASIRDNKIYGRGAIDDKGPVISSLYAMKAVKELSNINSRVRLILGVNEEKDWKCISHYKELEEWPTVGFSPDADFPCIYAEKGIQTIYVEEDFSKYKDLDIKILDIDCNNNAINVVPKFCKIILEVKENLLNSITTFLDSCIQNFGFDISYTFIENKIEIISQGIQAHAAHPDLGKNAISPMIILLNKLFNSYNIKINILEFFEKYIGNDFDGKSIGLNIEDESGKLTLNVGDFKLEDGIIKIGLNLRVPVNTSLDYTFSTITKLCENYNLKATVTSIQDPLYVPKDNELVKTLCNIFNTATNSNLEPIAIGGGTYARAFENCVSFGANFPGDTDMCHQANEFVDIDKLILSSKIYAKAIYELAK